MKTETDLELARLRMLTAERIVTARQGAIRLVETLREAAQRRADWDAVLTLFRSELTLALSDLERAETIHDDTAAEVGP